MALKGYIDFSQHRERARQKLIDKMGKPDYVPPNGWDGYLGTDDDLNKDQVCEMCGLTVIEIRPYGPNHESICEACAAKNPALSEQRWREEHPNAKG